MELRKLRDKATESFTKGRFSKAAELYEEYCQKDPKDIQARLRMGDSWAKAGQRPKAIAAYKSAAEAFAREGFLPRAIAASKLILELDPAHQGVQQMLADLYARRSGGPSARPAANPLPAAAPPPPPPSSKYEPIELPPVDLSPAPIDQTTSAVAPPAAPGFELEDPDGSGLPPELELATRGSGGPGPQLEVVEPGASDLPPELELELEEPAGDEPPPELELEVVDPRRRGLAREPAQVAEAPRAPVSGLPPGMRRREEPPPPPSRRDEPLAAAPTPAVQELAEPAMTVTIEVPDGFGAPPPPPAAALNGPARNELAAAGTQPRIWIPGTPTGPAAPPAASPPPPTRPAKGDLERALSRFDELSLDDVPEPASLDDAPAPPPPPQAPPPRLPSFTELELEGDSLLHAVEVAAQAGQTQRGEAVADVEVETGAEDDGEEVFSLTTEVEAPDGSPAALPQIPLFSDLPPDAFIELFDRCPLRRFANGERVIAQGSMGDAFYVLCEGSVRVVREHAEGETELAVLKDGAFFGEMALLSGSPRFASVFSADEDTQLLEISAPVLAQLSHRYPTVAQALKKFCRQRLLSNVMASSALFRPFSRGDRRALVQKFRSREAPKGTTLIREGGQADGLYVILSGEVEVAREGQVLARLHEGEVFGEMSLLRKTPATASVATIRRTSLLRLPREDFDALVLSHPQILVLVAELTDDRQRHTDAVLGGAAEVGEEGLLLV